MAIRKGKSGRSDTMPDYRGNILRDINLMASSGNTVRPSGTTDGTASMLTQKQQRARSVPYTAEQIAASPDLTTIKNALSTTTYEQALANYRALTKVSNMLTMGEGLSGENKLAYAKAYAALTPEQKNAETIFFGMGGSLKSNNPKYGNYGMGTVNTSLYNKLGVTAPTTSYAPVNYDPVGQDLDFKLANPLDATQKSRLQKLRSLGSLNARQSAALARLKAKKNAPTILP